MAGGDGVFWTGMGLLVVGAFMPVTGGGSAALIPWIIGGTGAALALKGNSMKAEEEAEGDGGGDHHDSEHHGSGTLKKFDPKTGKAVVEPNETDEEKGARIAQEFVDDSAGFDKGVRAAKDDYKDSAEHSRTPPSGESKSWYAGWRRGYRFHLSNTCNGFGSCASVNEDGKIDWPFGIWGS